MSDASEGPGWWQASDGKWYPPEQHPNARQQPQVPPPGYGPVPGYYYGPPQQRKGLSGGVIALVVVMLLLGLGFVGCVALVAVGVDEAADDLERTGEVGGVESNSGNTANPPQNDVVSVECVTDDRGDMHAELRITNHSSKRSNYFIDMVFETTDGGEQLDTSSMFVSDLEPGQSTTAEMSTFREPPAEGWNCRVVEVNRTAA